MDWVETCQSFNQALEKEIRADERRKLAHLIEYEIREGKQAFINDPYKMGYASAIENIIGYLKSKE